ncbi:MAG TPA: fumarylacetoacetate hydrolase family protein [Novosphingobium sp.]|nr:fumarylacetoacetate hydrolase family protein [Novosphingobium sp.]
MRYISFLRPDGSASYGVLAGESVADLGAAPGAPASLKEALAAGRLSALEPSGTLPLGSVTLLPPIPDPGKIFCVGLNYADHVAEMGREQKGYPAIFTRWADTLVAHGKPLMVPRESPCLDYEGELAVIIGKPGRRIARDRAMDHVAGFCVFNDASVRDWQRHNIQFTPGKNFPGTGGFGPAIVTPDEAGELAAQRVQTRVNGQLLQDQPVSDMIFDVPAIIAYLSSFTQLSPGDVIATGTPGGVGDKRKPPLYLQDGDRVEVSIGTIGTLANPVRSEV